MLGNKTELELMVNVSNLADSAYEAQVFIEHQKSVSYIATKKPVSLAESLSNESPRSSPLYSLSPPLDKCNVQQLQHDPRVMQPGQSDATQLHNRCLDTFRSQ